MKGLSIKAKMKVLASKSLQTKYTYLHIYKISTIDLQLISKRLNTKEVYEYVGEGRGESEVRGRFKKC